MVNIITAADFHFCDNPPSSRKDNYVQTLFDKLDQIYQVCSKTKASFLLIPGDLFHIKTASKTSHSLVQRLIKKFFEFRAIGCRVVAIPGNHDLSYSRLDSLSKQPLGTVASSGSLELLSFKETEWSKTEIFFSDEGFTLRIVGSAFGEFKEDSIENVTFKKGSEDYLICMAHIFASPLSTNFFGTTILGYNQMLDLEPDIFVFGHLHKDQNVHQIKNKYFVNVGAVSRGSISQDDLKRHPKICLIQIDGKNIKLQPISLKAAPFSAVFDYQAKIMSDNRFKEIDTFIQMISKEGTRSSQNVQDSLKMLSFAQEVKDRALVYLEKAK